MKKGTKLTLFIGLITAVAAVAASITALLLYLDHKKDEEELEHYLTALIPLFCYVIFVPLCLIQGGFP